MYTKIQKWGNSKAIRIPKRILEIVELQENDKVKIETNKDSIIIRRLSRKHKTLEERIADFSEDYKCTEWDTGKASGKEVW